MLGYRGAVSAPSQETPQQTPPPAGVQVGRYRLLTKIGEGGMGVVHLAQAPDGARVALKVLRPHIVGDDEARERLAREVSSLRRVTSPRIAEILDADPWGETPFVATRYIPGLSLHEHVRREGTISGEDLRWFASGLAEAVIAVHSVGVLHRDIKPSNILLEGRAPVLIDFGLARLAEDPRLTATGWLLGTPGYLAPEILYGDDATTASDVHSWAATVVYAATGRPPFGRGPAMAIMDRVRRGEHDLSGVPAALLPLIRQCLSPDPLGRPETAAVLADLRPAARGSGAAGQDMVTMPFALAAAADDDRTDVIGLDHPADEETEAHSSADTAPPPSPPTKPLTVHVPQAHPVHQPARAPYMTPAPPQHPYPAQAAVAQRRPLPAGLARLQRGSLLVGLLGLVTVGFAWAPYLSLVAIAAATLAIRTFSWTAESAGERRGRRGQARWYDGAVAVATTPWYLIVATGGTLLLLLWSATVAVVVGVAYLLFALPFVPGLLLMGVVLGVSLWWGPGSRRLRHPTRRLIVRATRKPAIGWVSVGVLALVVAAVAFVLVDSGVNWEPQPGPPWRPDTLLGSVVGYF